jgi:K+-transporting ATPase KdpF subunit
MDLVWIAAIAAMWVVMTETVLGLFDVLYGFAGLVAVILFAYLVFALICAEEF